MAITAPLITCGYAGANGRPTLALLGKAEWSETGALPYTTTRAAPQPRGLSDGDPVFTVIFPVDAFISIGPAPNAATGPRYFVPADTERSFYAAAGDKLQAVAP